MANEEMAAIQTKLDKAEESRKDLEKNLTTTTKERDELKDQVKEAHQEEARAKAKEAIGKAELPEPSKKRLVQQFEAVESADKLDEAIGEAIKAEKQYLADLAEAGKVQNLGESQKQEDDGQKALRETLIKSYQLKGKTVEEATVLAETDLNRR